VIRWRGGENRYVRGGRGQEWEQIFSGAGIAGVCVVFTEGFVSPGRLIPGGGCPHGRDQGVRQEALLSLDGMVRRGWFGGLSGRVPAVGGVGMDEGGREGVLSFPGAGACRRWGH